MAASLAHAEDCPLVFFQGGTVSQPTGLVFTEGEPKSYSSSSRARHYGCRSSQVVSLVKRHGPSTKRIAFPCKYNASSFHQLLKKKRKKNADTRCWTCVALRGASTHLPVLVNLLIRAITRQSCLHQGSPQSSSAMYGFFTQRWDVAAKHVPEAQKEYHLKCRIKKEVGCALEETRHHVRWPYIVKL